ncbi:hypothetical protein [Luteolibacter sp. LG18]|uniref:hypothetical protein n=1 Tax=Luteolibacter sp. LG18 TaxID=2819286 RepID=UPI0030C73A25
MVKRSHHRPPIVSALSNARQIGLALFDFDSDYSGFPDARTAAILRETTHTTLDLDDPTSNGVFRQLIAAGILSSEEIFQAQCHGSVRPDNRLGAGALARGECGFAFIVGGTNSSTGHSNRPLVVAPLIPGTMKFDPEPFEGQAVILRLDNSAVSVPIGRDGVVRIDGKDLFDPSQPYWEGSGPVVKWPDLPRATWWQRHATACVIGAVVAFIVGMFAGLSMWGRHLAKKACRPSDPADVGYPTRWNSRLARSSSMKEE